MKRTRHAGRIIQEETQRHIIEEPGSSVPTYENPQINIPHRESWSRGVNLGLVFVLLSLLAVVSNVWPVQATAESVFHLMVGLILVFGIGLVIPPLLVSGAGLFVDALVIMEQITYRFSAHDRARGQRERSRIDRSTVTIDGEYTLHKARQRREQQLLLDQYAAENDRAVFIAGVFGRNEPPSYRHWKERNFPSGRPLTHERWKNNFIDPLVDIGVLLPPLKKGQTYSVKETTPDAVRKQLSPPFFPS
jgi:hypothetical protein